MNMLNDLIRKISESNIQYMELKEIAEIGTGKSNKNASIPQGEFPFYVRSKKILRSKKFLFDEKAIIIPGEGDVGGIIHYVDGKYDLHQRAYRIAVKSEKINPKYVYYYLEAFFKDFIANKALEATVTSIRKPMVEKFLLAIPALDIQDEIVTILDLFTKLRAELSVELRERKHQYEHYIRLFLSKKDQVENVSLYKLSDVAKITAGGDAPKENFSTCRTSQFNVPIYSNGIGPNSLYGYTEKAKIHDPTVTVSARGTIGHCELREEPFYPIVRLICITPDKMKVIPKYLKYVIQLLNFNVPSAGIAQLTIPMVKDIKIHIPSIEEQFRIVNILDKFDRLINDVSGGIPAEIKMRKQQYEYYRNKLLSFEV